MPMNKGRVVFTISLLKVGADSSSAYRFSTDAEEDCGSIALTHGVAGCAAYVDLWI